MQRPDRARLRPAKTRRLEFLLGEALAAGRRHGKALASLIDLVRRGRFAGDRTVAFVHALLD